MIMPITRRYGLVVHAGDNLGDDIQAIAARAFLPRVDQMLERERLDCDPGQDLTVILNGWYMHQPQHWPPHPRIRALLLSLHVNQKMRRRFWKPAAARMFFHENNIAFLKRHAPIGARDRATKEVLERHGIEAWHSNCLTLTLERPAVERQDYIVANDLGARVSAWIKANSATPVVETTHRCRLTDTGKRFALAQDVLATYAGAKAVVTSRLHCALPCLAFGTPVLLVPKNPRDHRFSSMSELVRQASRAGLLSGDAGFDLDRPPANPRAFERYRDDLTRRCRAFITAL